MMSPSFKYSQKENIDVAAPKMKHSQDAALARTRLNKTAARIIPYALYFQDRFPLIPLIIFCALSIFGIASIFMHPIPKNQILWLTLVYIGFLLHLRILDEFKDYHYDAKYHPKRPVPSGSINLAFLKSLDLINLVLIVMFAFFVSSPQIFLLFALVLIYSALMFQDFFINNFYERSPALFLVAHQAVFVPFYLFFYSALNRSIWSPFALDKISHFIYLILPIVLIEIGRKISHRIDPSGHKTSDTYAYVWGQKTTLRVFAILIITAGALSLFIKNFQSYFSLLLIFAGAAVFLGSSRWQDMITKHSMLLTSIVALTLPSLLLL